MALLERRGQPAVLSELLGGMLLGNLILLKPAWIFFRAVRCFGFGGRFNFIFAGIGKSLSVIDDATFSAVVIMVIVTTLVTPPVLKLTLARREKVLAS